MSTQAPVGTAVVTADDLAAMPDDGVRRELVDERLTAVTPPGFEHGDIVLSIGGALQQHVRAHRLGRVAGGDPGFRLARDPDTVRAPDVAFVATERLPPGEERRGFLDVVPDLVVEVVSPSDRQVEVVEKALMWVSAGARLVWVVFPGDRLVVAYAAGGSVRHLSGEDVLDGGDVVPGFGLPLPELFD